MQKPPRVYDLQHGGPYSHLTPAALGRRAREEKKRASEAEKPATRSRWNRMKESAAARFSNLFKRKKKEEESGSSMGDNDQTPTLLTVGPSASELMGENQTWKEGGKRRKTKGRKSKRRKTKGRKTKGKKTKGRKTKRRKTKRRKTKGKKTSR